MALVAAQAVTQAGITPSFGAAANSDQFTPDDRCFLVVKNAGASPITVTLASYPDTSPWGAAIADNVVTVTNGSEKWIGPLFGSIYADPASGLGDIEYSATASVTRAVVKV